MSKTAWTPGPWSIITAKGYPYAIQASHVSPHAPGAIRDITRWAAISMPSSAEGQANARLIAEAPAMAELLMRFDSALNCGCVPCRGDCTSDKAKAIAFDAIRDETVAILARINGEAGR